MDSKANSWEGVWDDTLEAIKLIEIGKKPRQQKQISTKPRLVLAADCFMNLYSLLTFPHSDKKTQ